MSSPVQRTLVVGLTGGIGSGKSEVCRLFSELCIPIVDADIVAREVVKPGSHALEKIRAHFGDKILLNSNDGAIPALNRQMLREIIFADHTEKKWLEALLHPLINVAIRTQLAVLSGPYIILASPLLLETEQHRLVDRVLVIDASEELQMRRASARDSNNVAQIKAIMNTQLSRGERLARADDIIENEGSLADLNEQVKRLHEQYLGFTTKH